MDVEIEGQAIAVIRGVEQRPRIDIAAQLNSTSTAPVSAPKAAVAGITRSVALDYVADKIRCNAICPGTVQSPSLDERLAATGDEAAARAAFIARQPLGRLGTANEVAALALYLASDESTYTTGQLHVIDGGWCMA